MSRFVNTAVAAALLAFIPQSICGIGRAEPSGEADFRMSCSACHGDNGRGQGVKDFGLSVEPPDLTTLTRRNNGVFPRERLRRVIDGREDIKIHRDREMPVWGQVFSREAEEDLAEGEGSDTPVAQRIEALIDFIESLQQ